MGIKEKFHAWREKSRESHVAREGHESERKKAMADKLERENAILSQKVREDEALASALKKKQMLTQKRINLNQRIRQGSGSSGFFGGMASGFDKTVDAFIPREAQKRILGQGVVGRFDLVGGGFGAPAKARPQRHQARPRMQQVQYMMVPVQRMQRKSRPRPRQRPRSQAPQRVNVLGWP